MNSYIQHTPDTYYIITPSDHELTTVKEIFLLALISLYLLSCICSPQVKMSPAAFSEITLAKENYPPTQDATNATNSANINPDQTVARSFQETYLPKTNQGGAQALQFSSASSSSSASFTRHMMCKDFEEVSSIPKRYNPTNPTTIFRPSDTRAVMLTTVTINSRIECKWYYRSDSNKTWVLASFPLSKRSGNVSSPGAYDFAFWFDIAGYWPAYYYPRAYKVDVYFDDLPSSSFSEFFEVTNGGLNSPRMCEDVDADGHPVNIKSRFTIGNDTKAYHYLRFDQVAYFNEELGYCHNFTTVWIQPNGSVYETHERSFTDDYKDTNASWNCWNYAFAQDDNITINSSTPVGNWTVEVYLDSYYFNNTWMRYGPVATTPFIVGNESVADWTFMIYLDADNSLENASIEIFLDMASVDSSSQVNIVVQMDRIPGEDSRYDDWTDCYRFNVTKSMTPTPGNAVQNLSEVNMGDPNTLKDFVNWTINNYPANYYFLVLWDHGAGYIGVCSDFTDGDFLSLPELSQALSGLPAIMDVVFLDACNMGMTEVAYQIKDYANVLVGPEGLGYAPAPGTPTPYHNYLSSLTSNPSMLPIVFAREVVTYYIDWCNSISNIINATMSAIDLTKITSLIAAIDDFALKLKEKETLYHEQISKSRNLTEAYPGPYEGNFSYYIDLYHFAYQITYQYNIDDELRNAANQMMTALGNAIIKEANKNCPSSHGLSIYFPDEKKKYDYDDFEKVYKATTFAEDTPWDEFVKYHLSGYVLTIKTPYPNISIKVDEESYTTDASGKIQVFVLPAYHTINVTNPVLIALGSRGVFTQWNDSDTSNPRTLYVSGTTALRAEYETQHRLVMNTNFGTTNPSVGERWCRADSIIQISATAPSTTSGERYVWLGWNGTGSGSYNGINQQASITMNEPINQTADWRHEHSLTVTSLYGSPTHTSGWFETGQSITVSVTSPASGPTGTRYVCTGWNGTGSVSVSGTTTSTTFMINQSSIITWNWKTQYLLVARTNPTGIGSEPNVSPQGPWYDNGTQVICTAQKISGYSFDHWTADGASYDRGVDPITVTMDRPCEATAHYGRVLAWWETLLRPENMQIILGGMGLGLTVAFVGVAWIRTRRRRGIIKAFLNQIDEVYSKLKTNPQECEKELYRLRNTILEGLTDGRITEESYDIMDKKIDKYMEELQKEK